MQRGFGQTIHDMYEVGVLIFLFSLYLAAQLHEERNGSVIEKFLSKKNRYSSRRPPALISSLRLSVTGFVLSVRFDPRILTFR